MEIETKMKKLFILILVSGFTLSVLNACSTIEGIGKDIKRAGQAVEKEAKKH